jgi:hypothetical protein
MYLGVVGCCFLKEVNIAVIVPSFWKVSWAKPIKVFWEREVIEDFIWGRV